MFYVFDYHYSGISIKAAKDEQNNICIATPTIEDALGYDRNNARKKIASKAFKVFTGMALTPGKKSLKSNLNEDKANTYTYYPLETFFKLIYWEVNNGNQKAIDLVMAGFVTDFHGSLQNALGNTISEDERERIRTFIRQRIAALRVWTDIIRDRYVAFYGRKPERYEYAAMIKKANMAIFGVPHFNSDRTKNMSEEQQATIKMFEEFLARKAKNKPEWSPESILDIALEQFTT